MLALDLAYHLIWSIMNNFLLKVINSFNFDKWTNSHVSLSTLDFNGPLHPPHQCNVIHAVSKDFFSQIDWPTLQKDFSSKKNRNLWHAYHARFSEKERDLIKVQWAKTMIESQKHILFFDFLRKYFLSNNILNVVKKNFIKEDKTIVKSSHPSLENILIDCK